MSNEYYIRDPQTGQYIPDRRSTGGAPLEIQQILIKLVGKVDSLDTNVDHKFEIMNEKLSNLEEKFSGKLGLVEQKFKDHCEDDEAVSEILGTHSEKLIKAESYVQRIRDLESKTKKHDDKFIEHDTILKDIINKPMKQKAELIDEVLSKIKNGLIVVIATGIVGMIVYLFWFLIKQGGN